MGITEEWAIQWSSVCIPDFNRHFDVLFLQYPSTHISVEEHVSFSDLFHSANLLSICVCVREFKNGMLLSERDVDVMIRVGDRVCSLGFQCFVLCGYYQAKRKLEGLMFHFPRLGSC